MVLVGWELRSVETKTITAESENGIQSRSVGQIRQIYIDQIPFFSWSRKGVSSFSWSSKTARYRKKTLWKYKLTKKGPLRSKDFSIISSIRVSFQTRFRKECLEAESKEKHELWDSIPELTVTSPCVDSRVDSNTCPWATRCQSRLYPQSGT